MRTDTIRMSLCIALAFSSLTAGAQTSSMSRMDPSKRVDAAKSLASKGPRMATSSGGSSIDPLLGGPSAYDDTKLAEFGAPAEVPASQPYEKMTDIPPTPTERLALASARVGADRGAAGAGAGMGIKTRRSARAVSADDGNSGVYPVDVYSVRDPSLTSVYPLPW